MGTALLLNQTDIFHDCLGWVRTNLTFHVPGEESNVFEITIRVLGGLLSVYASTREQVLLDKAVELGDILLLAFLTPSGVPMSSVDFAKRVGVYSSADGGAASTAEGKGGGEAGDRVMRV